MKYKGHKAYKLENLTEALVIDFNPTNFCNYSCWYCWPGAHAGTQKFPPLNELSKKNLIHIVKSLQGDRKLVIKCSGGEPTMFSELINYMTFFKEELDAEIELMTNGSRTIKYWERNIKWFDFVSVSVHPLDADTDHLIKLGNLFKQNNLEYNMRVMVLADKMDLVHETARKLSSAGIRVSPKWIDLSMIDYAVEDVVTDWDPGKYKTEGVDFQAFDHKQPRAKQLVYDNTIIHYKTKKFKRLLEEKWRHTSLKDFKGSWNGYKCYAPAEYLFLKPDAGEGTVNGVIALTCRNDIQDGERDLKIFEKDYTDREFTPTVLCTTGYCKCEGLWKVGKEEHVVS